MITREQLDAYIRALQEVYATGKATEHSYREALRELLATLQDGLTVINEPKRIDVGAPDYIIQRDDVPLGFVEAKDLIVDLDKLDKRSQKQLEDYRGALPNLIHTNYLHFRWYVGGSLREDFSLGELKGGKIHLTRERYDDVAGMLARFIEQVAPTMNSPAELAKRMAAMARQIAILINNTLPDSDTLKAQMAAFEATLIPHLKADEFADMYAQTLAYGLFAARVRYGGKPPEGFTLQNAFWNLPDTNPFLRRFFQDIAPELDERVRWQADALAGLLAHAKMDDILKDFGRRTRTEDPVVHFYETFLREYDPAKREQRGVYYTPEPVVSYIVRSVDHLLRERFGKDGLADPNTLILDPATGTGTFLYFVIQQIHEQFAGQEGLWNSYVRDKLLPRLYGFELLMAPYAVAHMKLGIQLQETGYTFGGGQRLGIYLTNTLEEAIPAGQQQFAQFINQEANAATIIKRSSPIMVVLGNPPYSISSANSSDYIERLMERYKTAVRGEGNISPLSDDYIKFIRFAHDRIERTGYGIVGFVTNHSYLFGLVHRGMREELMKSFDEIYILNLHGNSLIGEVAPDNTIDKNVFDIRQGVAIVLMLKRQKSLGNSASVLYADLWGSREQKYKSLVESDIKSTQWDKLNPTSPYFFFVPKEFSLAEEYEKYWELSNVLTNGAMGTKTRRDSLMVDFNRDELKRRFTDIATNKDLDVLRQNYSISDTRYWSLQNAKEHISNEQVESLIKGYLYRPFDNRYVYYNKDIIERGDSRWPLMRHMLDDNLALCVTKQVLNEFHHVLCSTAIVDNCAVSLESRERTFVFPLYLYRDPGRMELPGEDEFPYDEAKGRRPNLSVKFVRAMESKLGMTFVTDGKGDLDKTFGPEDVFHYAYAVFHSPTYRERYAEFLKIDFPRLPLTGDKALFKALCQQGAALVDLHLLRGVKIAGTTFPESGNNVVESGYPKYEIQNPSPTLPVNGEGAGSASGKEEPFGRVYINKTQYFGGIAPEVWNFYVGGYQVLEKWLKDRRGRELSYEDIQHYQKVAAALGKTIDIMEAIDDLIPAWPLGE